MNKELIIKTLNRAIQVYAESGNRVYQTDIVEDFFPERMYVATLLERHPGSLVLPVKLKEGSGLFFLSYRPAYTGVIPRIAWEEDNDLHSLHSLLGYEGNGYLESREVKKDLSDIIGDFLQKYPFNFIYK